MIEKEVEVWGVIDLLGTNDKNFVMCFLDKTEAEAMFKNEFHLFTLRPFKIRYRYKLSNPEFSWKKIDYVEYEIVSHSEFYKTKYCVYISNNVNYLYVCDINGIKEEVCSIEYSSLPTFTEEFWFSQVISDYCRFLREKHG